MKFAIFKDYVPHKGQIEFHKACELEENKTILILSSIRSGNTLSLCREIVRNSWNTKMPSDTGNLVIAPTYRMLQELLEQPIVDLLWKCGLLKSHSYSSHKSVLKNGNQIFYRSSENFETIRGLNIKNAFVDEACLVSKEAIDVIKGRLLLFNGKLILATTPRGTQNWVYNDYYSTESKKKFKEVRYKLTDNPIITKEAIDNLLQEYDPLMCQQELFAEWVNLYQNRIIYSFDRSINVQPVKINPSYPIFIGLDFNVGVNAFVVAQYIYSNVYVFDEHSGAIDTTTVANIIKSKYNSPFVVIDSTGNNREQSALMTQKQVLNQAGIAQVYAPPQNPHRSARYANTNVFCKNGLKQTHLYIDPSCTKLINDLETLTFKNNSDEVDTQNNKKGHFTDALGYLIYYLSKGRAPQTY